MTSLSLWRRKPSTPPKQSSPRLHSSTTNNGYHRNSPSIPTARRLYHQQSISSTQRGLWPLLTMFGLGVVVMWALARLLFSLGGGIFQRNHASSIAVRPPPLSAVEQRQLHEVMAFLDASTATTTTALSDEWPYPLIHIVNTRFMQEQGHLKALGMARLYLFRTFCLPTMVHQSTQQFLWIIKTDPNLDAEILQPLVHDLQPYPNFYLVASNTNFMVKGRRHSEGGNNSTTHAEMASELPQNPPEQQNQQQELEGISWRDGAEPRDLLRSTIYTGSRELLWKAMMQKDRQVVLETRLDADDGLHRHYLRAIQEKALAQFLPSQSTADGSQTLKRHGGVFPKWLYWCAKRHVEWHGGVRKQEHLNQRYLQPQMRGTNLNNNTKSYGKEKDFTHNDTSNVLDLDYYGGLLVVEHAKLCITPGLTVGFGIGTETNDVPIYSHDKLAKAIHQLSPRHACGYSHSGACLEMVDDFMLMAVRARTPTSAGMQRVADDDDNSKGHIKNGHKKPKKPKVSANRMYLYWDLLHDDFAVLREQIKYTNQFILNHLKPIAQDNLIGQCTSDHSCKQDTKEKLLKIIEE